MDIAAWLRELGLERYETAFRNNDIDVDLLSDLTEADLERLGVASLGHRKKLLRAIEALRPPGPEVAAGAAAIADEASLGPSTRASRSEAERRQLTVLFCDLVGSTALAARLDPEDMREVLTGYQNVCSEVICRYEGHVAKFMGDGVLAYFGWPRAHEDEAERAVRAALQLVQDVARLEPRAEVRLQARVGIATGHVVVGDLVSESMSDRDAVSGDTPNLAARLQAIAPPGSVVISAATRRLVGGLFELTDLGPQRLKGFAEPLAVWRVEGQGRAEGRFEARHPAGLTPLVGRDEELSLLLRRWQQAKDGEGQVVLLSGEPGIGKSRLVRELRRRLEHEPHIRLLYQCSPYHTSSPLHPVIEQLERAAGFERDDTDEAKLGKLEALLAPGTERLDEAVPLVAALIGVARGDRYALPKLSPQRQKQLTLEALVEQLERLSAGQPVFLVYEDAHWMDPTTQELLDVAVQRIQHLEVLAIVTFRPEFVPPWSGQPHLSALALTRLGRRDGAAMVERIVGEKPLPAEVSAQIVGKTDGVPLFVEELTKTVLESGLLHDAGDRWELAGQLPPLAIPSTLHDSLLSRLDRLAPVKELAQIGAAIGREFSYALLAAVAERPETELQAALDQLVSSELVFRRGAPPESIYSFKHALVRETAYHSLLRGKRQQLHARIAEVLEERFPATVEAEPELLAHHCTAAGLSEKAVMYRYRAGQRALARSALAEAVAQLHQGLEALAGLPDCPERRRREMDLQVALGGALVAAKGYGAPETGRAFVRARELCREEGDVQRLFPVMNGQVLFHTMRAELHTADAIAAEMLGLARRQGDPALLIPAYRAMCLTSLQLGRFATVRDHAEMVLALYEPARHRALASSYTFDQRVVALGFLDSALFALGYPDQARLRGQEQLAEAQKLAHPSTLAQALHYACIFSWLPHLSPFHVPEHGRSPNENTDPWIHPSRPPRSDGPRAAISLIPPTRSASEAAQRAIHPRYPGIYHAPGDFEMFRQLAEALVEVAAEHGLPHFLAHGRVARGWALIEQGQADEGITEMRRALAAFQVSGERLQLAHVSGLLAAACIAAGRHSEALSWTAEARDWAGQDGNPWFKAEHHRRDGQALLGLPQPDQGAAEACFRRAIAVAQEQGARMWELRAATSLGQLWRNQGRHAEAYNLLAPVYGWFTEGFNTLDLKYARALLDELG